jgi:protein N-terminal glutamine amidohydrolase
MDKSALTYTRCYCEENAYLLLREGMPRFRAANRAAFAVFLSNPNRSVPVWTHPSAVEPPDPETPCVWDYHVVVLVAPPPPARSSSLSASPPLSTSRPPASSPREDEQLRATLQQVEVYDFDSSLDFPVSLGEYSARALRSHLPLKREFSACFRVIPGERFLECFSSDRSHMYNAKLDKYLSAPPSYSPLHGGAAFSAHELPLFIEMRERLCSPLRYGWVCDSLVELCRVLRREYCSD